MDNKPITLRKQKKKLVTERQAISAAEACGYSVIKVGCLKDRARLGKYVEQLGATQIARTTLLVATHEAETGIKQIQNMIDRNDGGEICLVMDLYRLKAAYIDIAMRAAANQMKAEKAIAVQSEAPVSLVMPFPPGTQLAAKIPEQPKEVNDARPGQ